MDQEIEKLEKQIELTDEYIAEIKKYAATDQANLRGINMGATFDENGRLNNYEQVLANIVADYNNAIAAYNSEVDVFNASEQEDADNSRLEAADKAVNKAKEIYDERLKILDQYEDTYNLLQQKMDERIDQVWELFDQRLEKITFKIDFELDWNEKEIEHLQWLLKYTGQEADHAADSIANLAKQMQTYEESIEWAKEGISDLFKLHGITFDFDNADPNELYNQLAAFMNANNLESQLTEGEAEALLKYMDTLRDAYDGMYDSWMEAHEKLMNAWDQWNERLEKNIEKLEEYAKEMEHIQKVIDLVGRKTLNLSSEDLDKLYAVQVQNAQDQTTALMAQRDAEKAWLDNRQEELQRMREIGADPMIIEQIEKEADEAEKAWIEANNNVRASFENTLELVEKRFEASLENTTKDYKNAFGKMGLDYIQEQFARQKDLDELYLDDFQKYHELNKTSNELNKSLNNTNNLEIRQKLLDLQDDINASMEVGTKVSAAQAEIYARRLALLQAESELLDAQNAKSAVRMTRDNEGNFSYTYTADQDQIGDAEQNYGDKFYELLQFERDYALQLQEEMLQKFQEFIDRRNEIAETYKDDQDAYTQAMEDLREEYLIYMDYFTDELNMDMEDMARLRDDDWKDFERYNNVKLAEYNDFLGKFNQLIIGELMPEYQTMDGLAVDWKNIMKASCDDSYKAVNTYQTDTKLSFEKAGKDITTYGGIVSKRFEKIAEESEDTAEATEQMAEDMSQYMQDIADDADELDYAWAETMKSMRDQIDHTISSLGALLQQLDLVKQAANEALNAAAAAMSAGGTGDWSGSWDNGDSGSGEGAGNKKVEIGITVTDDDDDKIMYHSGGGSGLTIAGRQTQHSMDTGGYTGEFGPAGKWAILHEKEIVLNKEDTANMLNIVSMVRDMVGSFDTNQRLDNLLSMATAATGIAGPQAQSLEQQVHIEANFPNVQSHTEIELALNNLINSASQYVNRKS